MMQGMRRGPEPAANRDEMKRALSIGQRPVCQCVSAGINKYVNDEVIIWSADGRRIC